MAALTLVASGVMAAAALLGTRLAHPVALLGEPYGLGLASKAAAFAVMVLVAAVARLVVLGPEGQARSRIAKALGAGLREPDDATRFGRVVAVETAFGLIAIGIAAILAVTPPPA